MSSMSRTDSRAALWGEVGTLKDQSRELCCCHSLLSVFVRRFCSFLNEPWRGVADNLLNSALKLFIDLKTEGGVMSWGLCWCCGLILIKLDSTRRYKEYAHQVTSLHFCFFSMVSHTHDRTTKPKTGKKLSICYCSLSFKPSAEWMMFEHFLNWDGWNMLLYSCVSHSTCNLSKAVLHVVAQ